jgi:pilus assembly protein Flp/PilA
LSTAFDGRLPHVTTANPISDGGRNMISRIRRFLQSEDGPTAVEYAVMLALIVIVCLTAINSIGTNAKTSFTKVATSLQSAS